MITYKTARALSILRDMCVTATEFAEHMWPDSPGWQRMSNVGTHGASAGACMPYAAGGYLGRLRKRGLVEHDSRRGLYMLTHVGTIALDAYIASLDPWLIACRTRLGPWTEVGTECDVESARAIAQDLFLEDAKKQIIVVRNRPLWEDGKPRIQLGAKDAQLYEQTHGIKPPIRADARGMISDRESDWF